MKKTLILLLGLLAVAALPGKGLRAQTKTIDVTVATLDNAPVTSVTIYAGDLLVDYYVDDEHLGSGYAGDPIAINTLTSYSLIPNESGHFQQNVDSTLYGISLVAAVDANGNVYVYGAHTSVERAMGVFHANSIFDGIAAGDTLFVTLNVPANMLMTVPTTVAHDLAGARYQTMASALANAPTGTTITIDADIDIDETLVIDRNLSISQNGKTLTSNTDVAVQSSTSLAAWNGNNGVITSSVAGGTFFKVTTGILMLSNTEADVAGTIATISGNGGVNVSGNNVYTAANIAYDFDATSTGTVMLPESAILNDMGNCGVAVNGDAFRSSGLNRAYYRTISMAAAVATSGETIYVGRKTAAGITDTIANNITLNLNGDTVLGTIVHASNMPLVVTNGVLNHLKGDDTHSGLIDLRMLNATDSLGQLAPGTHATIVENGRVKTIYPSTGAYVAILAGKFGQAYRNYLAPRHSFVQNDESDAEAFPVKVVDGYTVTLVDYNAEGDTATFVANTANNQIHPSDFPLLAAQDNVETGSLYTFLYWACNEDFSTPWVFDRMVLTKDTTLYAKWAVYNPSTDIRVSKEDYITELDGTVTRVDSLFVGVLSMGNNDTTVNASIFIGFQDGTPAYYHLENVDVDTVLRFNYVRDTFELTWNLDGGTFADGRPTTERLAYGTPVVYPAVSNVVRPGFVCTGWQPSAAQLTTMPAASRVVNALYDTIKYDLVWNGANSSVVYNGQATNAVSVSFTDESGTVFNPELRYYNVSDPSTELTEAVKVGTYTVKPVNDGTHYFNEPTSTTLTITPAPLHVVEGSVVVEEVKLYDGLPSAVVSDTGSLATVYGNDDVRLYTIANFSSTEVGEGLTITAYFTVIGDDMSNYTFTTTDSVVSTNGVILQKPAVAENGIVVDADGYCGGDSDAAIDYTLSEGAADQYKLVFSEEAAAQGFVDVDWTNITTAGQISIDVPVDAAVGNYIVYLTLRSSAYPQYESALNPVLFHVNLTKEVIKPIFADVISIVDTDAAHPIDQSGVKWYHMGVGETSWTHVGDGPYYREEGGLTGQYYAEVVFLNGTTSATCVQDDMTTIVEEAETPATTVNVYPNPTVDQVSVLLENATSSRHTLKVMNIMGVTMLQTTFDGDMTTIDFNNFINGSYTVSVDGIVVRVIKK